MLVIALEGFIHPLNIVRITAKGDARKHTNGDHQNDGQEAKFGSPQATCQTFVEKSRHGFTSRFFVVVDAFV